jgi:hypothetical protein
VLRVLAEHGELTRAEMCMHLGLSRFLLSSVVTRLYLAHKMVPKRIYIKRWVHEDDTTTRWYPKSVYAIGDLPDAKKPKPRPMKENSRKWREKERYRVNSVFMFAQPRKVRHAMRRGESLATEEKV